MTRTMLTAILLMSAQLPCAAQDAASETSISLAAFSDGIKHWQDRHGKDYARYQPQQITEIADNLLLYQRDNGGWIENRDPARILDATEKAALVAEKAEATRQLRQSKHLLPDRIPRGRVRADRQNRLSRRGCARTRLRARATDRELRRLAAHGPRHGELSRLHHDRRRSDFGAVAAAAQDLRGRRSVRLCRCGDARTGEGCARPR